MKTIIVNEAQMEALRKNMNMVNEEVTLFSFMSHIKAYLKQLLNDPIYAKPDAFLLSNGLDGERVLSLLMDNGIIIRDEKIDSSGNKDQFVISYKIPRQNFERKIKRLYTKLFEQNTRELNEEVGGGATSADASGAYEQPLFGKPLRRKTIYVTQEQYDRLEKLKEAVEMDTAFGDFGYDAPPFNDKKNDPAYDHSDLIKNSVGDGQNGKI
jgi:hypothetical protein